MEEIQRILLLGNGINDALGENKENKINWDDILTYVQEKLIEENFIEPNKKINPKNKETSATQLFESWCTNDKEKFVREKVCEYILSKKINLSPLGLWNKTDIIITTNFDKNLIDCAPKKSSKGFVNNDKYLTRRMDFTKGKHIFCIHGHCDFEKSICLGFDQYITNLTKIQSFVKANYPRKDKNGEVKFIYKTDGKRKSFSWVDYFFAPNTEIDILGLNLCSEEIDLWWLLKQRSKYSELLRNNVIRYFDLASSSNSKKTILRSMYVDVEEISGSEGYDEQFYKSCLDKIPNLPIK